MLLESNVLKEKTVVMPLVLKYSFKKTTLTTLFISLFYSYRGYNITNSIRCAWKGNNC